MKNEATDFVENKPDSKKGRAKTNPKSRPKTLHSVREGRQIAQARLRYPSLFRVTLMKSTVAMVSEGKGRPKIYRCQRIGMA